MATLRELKGRIGSVASSEKITGAMKMISSAKMHKAEGQLKRLVPFRNQINTIIANLLNSDATFTSPLTQERPVKNLTIVVWGSDDGLCGAYNVNIAKQLVAYIKTLKTQQPTIQKITVIPIGRKIQNICQSLSGFDIQVPAQVNAKSQDEAVNTFTRQLVEMYTSQNTDRLDVIYMNFQSVSRQRLAHDQLLPLNPASLLKTQQSTTANPVIFEPDANTIFNTVLPLYLMSTTQEIFTENRASEQAARVMAMQSANDNAKKLLEQLQLEYNKLRQQSITTELLDIVGGQVRE